MNVQHTLESLSSLIYFLDVNSESDELQKITYQTTSKVLTTMVVGTIVSLVAKYVLKLPSPVIKAIFFYNMYNLSNTVTKTIQRSYALSQAVTPLEDLFLEHFLPMRI